MSLVLNNVTVDHHLNDLISQKLSSCFIFRDKVFVWKVVRSTKIAFIHVEWFFRFQHISQFKTFIKRIFDHIWRYFWCQQRLFFCWCLTHWGNRRDLMMRLIFWLDIFFFTDVDDWTSFFLRCEVKSSHITSFHRFFVFIQSWVTCVWGSKESSLDW